MLYFTPKIFTKYLKNIDSFDANTIKMGEDRVIAAIKGVHPGMNQYNEWMAGKEIQYIVRNHRYTNEEDNVMSFLSGISICRQTENPKLMGRYAYIESLYITYMLSQSPTYENISNVCENVLHFRPKHVKDIYNIPVHKYIPLASTLGKHWSLVNQNTIYG